MAEEMSTAGLSPSKHAERRDLRQNRAASKRQSKAMTRGAKCRWRLLLIIRERREAPLRQQLSYEKGLLAHQCVHFCQRGARHC